MWLVVYFSIANFTISFTYNLEFQNSGGAMKMVSNATREILLASTQCSFVMATSNVLMAVMKNLAVSVKFHS